VQVEYLFHFGGLSKRHHVFVAHLPGDASPEPRNEIARCEWFSATKIATLSTSVPTREIVGLFVRHTRHDVSPSVELADNAVSETREPPPAVALYRAS
jgi:8-oxo-dGTP diphosphatase